MSDDIGLRLKTIRTTKGLSQRELAKRAGIANATISLIESGGMNPSIGALKRIVAGLQMDLAGFFSLELPKGQTHFYKQDQLVEIGKGGISYKLVAADRPDKKLQVIHETYQPGSDTGRVSLSHEGEECGLILSGSLEVWVGEQKRILSPGDAYYFDSREPHRFRNPGTCICEVVSVCTPASF